MIGMWLVAWISVNGHKITPMPGKVETASRPVPYWVVQFEGPIQQAWRQHLEAQGLQILFYLPQNAFVVRTPQPTRSLKFSAANKAERPVLWAGPFEDTWKIHPNYREKIQSDPFAEDTVVINLFPGEDPFQLKKDLEARGGRVLDVWVGPPDYFSRVIAVMKRADLPGVAAITAVAHLEKRPRYRLFNNRDRWVLQTNRVDNTNPDTAVWAAGIHGEGQILAVMDSELDENSCFFRDDPNKVIANIIYPGAASGGPAGAHGTHVAGTALGYTTDATNWVYNGLAYKARLVFQDWGIPKKTCPASLRPW